MGFFDDLASKPFRLVAGAMSGTSMDAIDVAVCQICGAGERAKIELKRFESVRYQGELAKRLRSPAEFSVRDVAELNVLVGQAFARAVGTASRGLSLDLVGSHGQTIYHHSRMSGALKATLQIGDGDVIADRLGVPVVSDFRMSDTASGGEGAPLTPYTDFILYGAVEGRAILNLGGIANITLLGSNLGEVRGFDTGPANAPLDRIANIEFGVPYDTDGDFARAGEYDPELLAELLKEDVFLDLKPPKSTGVETYGNDFVAMLQARSRTLGVHLMRLATEYVVESIARSVPEETQEIILAGGGAKSTFLRERLQARLSHCKVRLSDEVGVPSQAREAMAFAVLANDALCGLKTSLKGVTGASRAKSLGKLSFS